MNPKPRFQTWRWLAVMLSLVLSSLGVAIPVKAQAARAETVETQIEDQEARPSPQQVESFDDLPLGLAPVIARTLADDLPDSFHLRAIEGGYQADNPAHDLTTTFTPTGPQMAIGGETWGLTLTGLGREGTVQALPTAELAADGPRLEYQRDNLTEWYLNTHWGLEQGFTLQTRPAGSGELVLELTMSGSLQASLQACGDYSPERSERERSRTDDTSLLLANAAGQTIARYTGLHAYDANGRQLPAYLSLSSTSLSIVVDDFTATYPLTVDPWVQKAKLLASDGTYYDFFGYSMAVSGDTVVVGAPFNDDYGTDSGSAYVFVEPAGGWSGTLIQSAKLLPDDGATYDDFGDSVAVSGDTVVVGTPIDVDNGSGSGSAYVFVEPVGGWSGTLNQTAKLLPSDGAAGDYFGDSVTISGDTVVVGTSGDDDNGDGSGSAYVFVGPVGGWSGVLSQSAKLLPDDGATDDYFGRSVAISGDTVIVGASGDDDNGDGSGSAYVFVEPVGGWSGVLNQSAKLLPDDGATGDYFGHSISISGDAGAVAVGAHDDDGNTSGPAYVFVEPAGGWSGTLSQSAKLLPDDGAMDIGFGVSVSISDDAGMVVVGAPWEDVGGFMWIGAAYVFVEPAGGWSGTLIQSAKLLASDGSVSDRFGWSVAISSDTVVVGAIYGDNDDEEESGSAYVFEDVFLSDLGITKAVTPTTATPGETVTYTLAFSNAGTSTATDVTLIDVVPVSVTVQSVVNSGATITDTGTVPAYVWAVEDLSVGEWGFITITGVLSDPLASGTFTNTANIDADQADSNVANDEDSAAITVVEPVCTEVADVTLAYTNTGTIYTDTIVYFLADLTPDEADPDYNYIVTIDALPGATMSSATEPLAFQYTFADTGTHTVEFATWNCDMTLPNVVTTTLDVEVYEPGTCVDLKTITILGDATGYVGVEYTFDTEYTPLGASLPINYLWDEGETTASIARTFALTGTYTLVVTATNCTDALVTDEHIVTISEQAITCTEVSGVDLSLDNTGDIYPGTQVDLAADVSPDDATKPYSYTLDYGDGSALVSGSSSDDPFIFDYTYASTGTFTVEFWAWNCAMTEPVSDTVQVVVGEQGPQQLTIYLPIVLRQN